MALSSWLASLKADVSNISGVQAPIYAGLGRYVTEATDVSGVSETCGVVACDTADTARERQTYQRQPAWALACTGDASDTAEVINTDSQTTEAAATPTQTEPMRRFRPREPWLTDSEQAAATAYYAHHFSCHTCVAAGRGDCYGKRCELGLALWSEYDE